MTSRSTVSPGPLVQALRAATATQHARVETTLGGRTAVGTREGYSELLRVTLAVVAPVEPALVAHLGPLVAAPPPSTRVARLEADLEALGCAARLREPVVAVRSRADAWGAAYVIQGSLLGGAIIVRRLEEAFAPASAPASYLRMYGTDLGQRWLAFCAGANAFGAAASAAARDEALTAATRTFDAFEAALARL